MNEGRLEIDSGYAAGAVLPQGRFTDTEGRYPPFPGTLINLTLKCDDRHYRLVEEVDDGRPWF